MSAFSYVTVASAFHDARTVDRLTAGICASLDGVGGVPAARPEDRPLWPMAILAATGGTEATILELVRRRHVLVPFEPVVLLAHPLHNSLPAALEAMARVHADGGRGRIVQVDAAAPGRVATVASDIAAIHRLHRTRLGLVGEPSPWLVASVPDTALLRARWGVELVPIDIGSTIDGFNKADPSRARGVAVRFAGRAEPSAELLSAATLHPVLVDTIRRAGVDAIAVRCFDYLGELTTSGCVALAELNDAGVVAGCEGDVASTVAMVLVRALLDQPSWIANLASIDEERDRVLLAHCTVAPSLVEDIELHTHFESGLGIGLRGRFAPGWVTLLRLGGAALDRLWVAEAEVEDSGDADDLCRTQVTVHLDGVPASSLLDTPLGNHLLLFHGRHRDRVERWWRLAFGQGGASGQRGAVPDERGSLDPVVRLGRPAGRG
jgi:L-fucose isomerase-like protein